MPATVLIKKSFSLLLVTSFKRLIITRLNGSDHLNVCLPPPPPPHTFNSLFDISIRSLNLERVDLFSMFLSRFFQREKMILLKLKKKCRNKSVLRRGNANLDLISIVFLLSTSVLKKTLTKLIPSAKHM